MQDGFRNVGLQHNLLMCVCIINCREQLERMGRREKWETRAEWEVQANRLDTSPYTCEKTNITPTIICTTSTLHSVYNSLSLCIGLEGDER